MAVPKAGIGRNPKCLTFRHSFATHLLEKRYDIRTVQELLGHKEVKTPMIYIRVQNRGGKRVRTPVDAFITPYYDCRLMAYYQITDQSLKNLQGKVPSSVLKKLGRIQNQLWFTKREYQKFLKDFPPAEKILKSLIRPIDNKFCMDIVKISHSQKKALGKKAFHEIEKLVEEQKVRVREEFLTALKATIGNIQTAKYGSLILKHAKISDNKTYTVDVTLSAPSQTSSASPVIGEAIHKLIEYFKMYKITKKTLKELKSKKLPDDVRNKLESIKNQKVRGKVEFLNLLKETIGDEQTVRYKSLILEHVKSFRDRKSKTICDFGAGKLRNVRPFLVAGFTVYAVEYEDQFNYPATQRMANKLRIDFPIRFRKLLTSEFGDSNLEFDAVLLIFVTHIVPHIKDRDLIIECCSEKLRRGGLLVWVTPHRDTNMLNLCKPQYGYKGGWIMHAESPQSMKTFYTEFRVAQIDKMVRKHGLKLIERLNFFKNKARIYEKT